MLKIGEFSRLGQVTVKTLRHYDRIGLLKPAEVDTFTGYRYYSSSQLPRLNRILALKDLDLSLEEIASLLDGDLPAGEIRGMLKLKRAELHDQLREKQAQLERVEARLKQIEREGSMSPYEVVLKEVPAQRVLAIREIAPEVAYIGQLFNEVGQAVGRAGIVSTGPWLALYYHEEYREDNLDLEVAVPVAADFAGTLTLSEGRVMTVRDLPARTMATILTALDSQATVQAVNQQLCAWCCDNSYTILTPCREAYPGSPEDDPMLFETQYPVEKR